MLLGISEGDYSKEELFQYLGKVTRAGKIDGSYDSDNKARDIVRKWRSGKLDIDLFPATRRLLILEMQDGHGVGILFPRSPDEHSESAERQSGHCGKGQQDSYQNESIDDQIADVVAPRGYVLAPGDRSLVPNV